MNNTDAILLNEKINSFLNIDLDSNINDLNAILNWSTEYKSNFNTYKSYKTVGLKFLIWLRSQGLCFNNVDRLKIEEYRDFLSNPEPRDFWCGIALPLLNDEWRPFVKSLSVTSINYNLQILKAFFEYLINVDYITKNPFKLIKRLKEGIIKNQQVERFLNENEFRYVLNYIDRKKLNDLKQQRENARLRWIFVLLYFTGCRRSEVANALMSDVFKRKNKYWLKIIGKGNKYREIPINEQLLNEFISYRRINSLPKYPSQDEKYGLIMSLGINEKISDSMIYKLIKKLFNEVYNTLVEETEMLDEINKNKFLKASTHWMRHTSATHQVDAGVDIRSVQRNLGHSKLETTMKYQHKEAEVRHEENETKFKI